jgi:hypothetical protein
MSDTDPRPRPRRRRRRALGRQGPPPPAADAGTEDGGTLEVYASPSADDAAAGPATPSPRPKRPRGGKPRDPGERALRDLVGNTPTQLGPVGALRGRDVNRPTEDDLAAAERDVVIVRRNWTPPD